MLNLQLNGTQAFIKLPRRFGPDLEGYGESLGRGPLTDQDPSPRRPIEQVNPELLLGPCPVRADHCDPPVRMAVQRHQCQEPPRGRAAICDVLPRKPVTPCTEEASGEFARFRRPFRLDTAPGCWTILGEQMEENRPRRAACEHWTRLSCPRSPSLPQFLSWLAPEVTSLNLLSRAEPQSAKDAARHPRTRLPVPEW